MHSTQYTVPQGKVLYIHGNGEANDSRLEINSSEFSWPYTQIEQKPLYIDELETITDMWGDDFIITGLLFDKILGVEILSHQFLSSDQGITYTVPVGKQLYIYSKEGGTITLSNDDNVVSTNNRM